MTSPQVQEACGEHKLSVGDKNEERLTRLQRAQWLRAAILGANDGLLSTTSLMLGVGAAKEDQQLMILSGVAGAVAGACSMAVGEFVSVSTQRDIERETLNLSAQISHETDMIKTSPASRTTLSNKFMLDSELQLEKGSPAMTPKSPRVAPSPKSSLMKVIASDTRTSEVQRQEQEDEMGALPNPFKAAAASALAFLCGSIVPLLPAIVVAKHEIRVVVIVAVTSIALVVFGGFGAYLGGSQIRTSAARVLLGGWASMAISYGLLKPFDKERKHPDPE